MTEEISKSIESNNANETLMMEICPEGSEENKIESGKGITKFLQKLIDVSQENSQRLKNKYDDTLKKFATYLFYTGGRLLYESLQSNLKNALPSISALSRFWHDTAPPLEEGEIDFVGLVKHCDDRNIPKIVWLAEDATRITGKIEYDPRTNKVIGFVLPLKDGLPDKNSFLATCAKAMESYFIQHREQRMFMYLWHSLFPQMQLHFVCPHSELTINSMPKMLFLAGIL